MHSPRPAASHTSNPVNGSVLPDGSCLPDEDEDVVIAGAVVEVALVAVGVVVVVVGVTVDVVGLDEVDVDGVVDELPELVLLWL